MRVFTSTNMHQLRNNFSGHKIAAKSGQPRSAELAPIGTTYLNRHADRLARMFLPDPGLRRTNQNRFNQRFILQFKKQFLGDIVRTLINQRLCRIKDEIFIQPGTKCLRQIAHGIPLIHTFFVEPVHDLFCTKAWKAGVLYLYLQAFQCFAKEARFFRNQFHNKKTNDRIFENLHRNR